MLAVAGGKGGCGKTTTALGLGAALARQRKAALAVDTDREMPDLHAMAGVAREPGLDAVAEGWPPRLVAGRADPPTVGVEVLPAADGPPSASPPSRASPTGSGRAALARLRGCADAVLLDCPAGAGPDAAAPLRAADVAALVTTAEPACLRDAAKTAAMARELGTPVAGAVVSRVDSPPEGVSRLLDCPVLGAVPDAGSGAGTDPLADDRVRAAHDRVASALQPQCL